MPHGLLSHALLSDVLTPHLPDRLTGLPLRESLERVAAEALADREASRGVVSLLAVRLEPSGGWSDVYRRRVLRWIAQALRGATRATDLVARTSEHEFMVLLPGACKEQARSVMVRVQIALGRYLDRRGQRLNARRVRASVATAPDDGDTVDALLSCLSRSIPENETASRSRAG